MDKEKEIQDINQVLSECVDYVSTEKCRNTDECNRCHAEILYNLGYRKAEDVRKETAEEILQDFYDQTFEMKDPYNGDVDEQKEVIDRGDILNMAEHFNIKVDE